MRASSLMRFGAKILGDDSNTGLGGVVGAAAQKVWKRRPQLNMKRSTGSLIEYDSTDDDGRSVDFTTIVNAVARRGVVDKGKSTVGLTDELVDVEATVIKSVGGNDKHVGFVIKSATAGEDGCGREPPGSARYNEETSD